jgi:hypothetical protein
LETSNSEEKRKSDRNGKGDTKNSDAAEKPKSSDAVVSTPSKPKTTAEVWILS